MKPSALLAGLNHLPIWRWRVRVWDFTLTPPTFDRWLYLWMHRLGRMGADDAVLLRQMIQPGMQVADVGANLGLYSLLLARYVGPAGRIYAFEPDARMAAALRQNIAANGHPPIEVFECAAGSTSGHAVLQRNAMNSGDNRLGQTTGTALHSEQASVPVRALSEALQGRRIDFIKMDVQGWEGEALRGLGGLLEANPGLQIYFEFWPHGLQRAGTEVAQLADILRGLGLKVTQAGLAGSTVPVDLVALAHGMAPKAYTNLLARR
jgi:FkbM family methyltransferase